MMRKFCLCLMCWCLIIPAGGLAAQATSGAEFEQRLKTLETELRCLVCQNQTLADSNAGLAEDLRKEVRTLAQQGKSDDEIKDFLTTRYGDFVLYNPRVKAITWLLWFGPFVLLAAGAGIFFFIVRRRSKTVAEPELSEAERKKTEDLLS
jgi:cytochrome c-type biogenesis protein CcmH